MINDLPQFDRLPLIPQLEEAEKEIFHPHWNCFCCQDSGFIQPHLVKKIIPDYNYNQDKNVACLDWIKAGELGISEAYTNIKDNCN